MALNDEAERLETAEEYLLRYSAASQEFEAAMEHLRWVYQNKPEYAVRIGQIHKRVIQHAEKAGDAAKLARLKK